MTFLTLAHVVDNSHDLLRPRRDVRGAVIAVEAVAAVHGAEGVDSVEDPDAVTVAVGHHRTARVPAAGLEGNSEEKIVFNSIFIK